MDFVSEAKLLSQIPPSEFVVKWFGMCREPFCILTEFINGGTLESYLRK